LPSTGIVVLPHVWARLHDYQQERILTFIDPERDPVGLGLPYPPVEDRHRLGRPLAGEGLGV
jgi:rod shape determining protein RodA